MVSDDFHARKIWEMFDRDLFIIFVTSCLLVAVGCVKPERYYFVLIVPSLLYICLHKLFLFLERKDMENEQEKNY